LQHRLRNRGSNRSIDRGRRGRILKSYQSKYGDFGPTLAAEYLLRDEHEGVGVETLRHWLIEGGLWQTRRQGPRHRQWRERRAHWGELVQMDGSDHDWFEGRRARASLMVMIDDATNWTHAKFFESETTVAAMTVFGEYVEMLTLEKRLIDFARDGRGRCQPIGDPQRPCSREWFNDGQKAAVRHVLGSRDRVMILRGVAGKNHP
jgi:hypothetical protein